MKERAKHSNIARRQDRAQSDRWISESLRASPFGMLATIDHDQPYIHPTTFVYDEKAHAIYFHTYREGRTRSCIEAHECVSFGVAEMGRLLPAGTAMGMGVEYASAIVFGECRIVADETEAARGLQMLLDKYFPHLRPGEDYRPIVAVEAALTTVFRIDISAWSGKEKRASADYPGAFVHGRPPGKT